MSYTYVILQVSNRTYREIHEKLEKADYHQAFHEQGEHGVVIDMHGIALAKDPTPVPVEFPTLKELERRAIKESLERNNGSVAKVARELGIGRATLYRRLGEFELPHGANSGG